MVREYYKKVDKLQKVVNKVAIDYKGKKYNELKKIVTKIIPLDIDFEGDIYYIKIVSRQIENNTLVFCVEGKKGKYSRDFYKTYFAKKENESIIEADNLELLLNLSANE